MGRELVCTVRFDGRAVEGKALRETSDLIFRSPELRLKIPFGEMSAVVARDGELVVDWPDGEALFELGAREAERWATAILHPPSLLDKLGVKPGQRVSLLNAVRGPFLRETRRKRPLPTTRTSIPSRTSQKGEDVAVVDDFTSYLARLARRR